MNAMASETTWLTYEDGARRFGIKADSLKRRAAARKWPRRLGNDGRAEVGIPTHLIPPPLAPDARDAHIPAHIPDAPSPSERAGASEEAVELAAAKAQIAGLEARLADTQADRDRLAVLLATALEPRPGLIERWLRALRS